MFEGRTVGVVVPAYNEQGLVGDVVDTVPEFVDRVYVVDDRSTDGTWREILDHAEAANREAAMSDPDAEFDTATGIADGGAAFDRRVVPIRHETNRGVGAAIVTGYRRAREDGLDVTAVMAGDGQMDPDILDRLVAPVADGEADYAKGNRLLSPAFREGMPRFRLFGNRLLSLLTKVASGYWRTGDPQNGYTAISGRALDELDLDALYDDYGFANDLLVRLNCRGMAVADVATPAVYGDEESTIRYRTFVPKLSWLLLRSFCHRLRTQFGQPGGRLPVAGYLLGALGLVAAAVSGLSAGVESAATFLLASIGALGVAVHRDRERDSGLETRVADDGAVDRGPSGESTRGSSGESTRGPAARSGRGPTGGSARGAADEPNHGVNLRTRE